MKKRMLLLGFLAAALTATAGAGDMPAAGKIDARTAFNKLKTLTGDWNGTGDMGMATPVTYRLSANGNVVMETLYGGTQHEMITMYHLAGNNLVATHYCSMGNQPHFKLDVERSTPNELVFAFDGGTNFDPAKDSHVHDGRIDFIADGKVDSTWEYYEGGQKKSDTFFHLSRAAK